MALVHWTYVQSNPSGYESRLVVVLANGVSTSPTNENAMNWSMYTADCTTHLKIVVVGLVAALLIVAIGISGRGLNLGSDIMSARPPTVIKAGAPIAFTDRTGPVVR